jgi:hypothetical protein
VARLNICGFETGDESEAIVAGSTRSVQSTVKRTGTYGARFNWTAQNGWLGFGKYSAAGVHVAMGLTTIFVTGYLQIDTANGSLGAPVAQVCNSAFSSIIRVFQTATGALELVGATNSSPTAVLTTGVMHRIDLTVVSNGTCSLSVDGATAVTCTGSNVTIDYFLCGNNSGNSGNTDFTWDDIRIDDAALPGAGQVSILRPRAAGSSAQWTTGTSSLFSAVNEVPPDGDTSYIKDSTSTHVSSFAMDSSATGGVSGTIAAVKTLAITRDEGGASSVKVRLRNGSTSNDTTGTDPGATYVALARLDATDPNTSAAWTTAGLDTIEAGVVNNASVAARVTAIYVMADYLPSTTVTSDVTTAAALAQTVTSDVTSAAALSEAPTSDVTSGAALSVAVTRDVTSAASISTGAIVTSDVTTAAAIAATVTRDVTSAAALSVAVTRDVTSAAAISTTQTRDVTSAAAVSRAPTSDVTTAAATNAPVSSDVTSAAAIQGNPSSDVTTAAALSVAVSRDLTSTAAVSQTVTTDVTSAAALSQAPTRDVTSAAALSAPAVRDVTSAAATALGAAEDVLTTAAIQIQIHFPPKNNLPFTMGGGSVSAATSGGGTVGASRTGGAVVTASSRMGGGSAL